MRNHAPDIWAKSHLAENGTVTQLDQALFRVVGRINQHPWSGVGRCCQKNQMRAS